MGKQCLLLVITSLSSLIMFRAHVLHTVLDGRRCQNPGPVDTMLQAEGGLFVCLQTVFLGFGRYYCLSLAWFSSGKSCITDSVVVLSVVHVLEGLSARNEVSNLCHTSCTCIQPAAAPACSQTSFSFPADRSALGFELTSDLELFIQSFLVFQLERKSLIFHKSLVDVITYFPSRHAADVHHAGTRYADMHFAPQTCILPAFFVHTFSHCCEHFFCATRTEIHQCLSGAVCLSPMDRVSSVKAVHGLCHRNYYSEDWHFAGSSLSRRTKGLRRDRV